MLCRLHYMYHIPCAIYHTPHHYALHDTYYTMTYQATKQMLIYIKIRICKLIMRGVLNRGPLKVHITYAK